MPIYYFHRVNGVVTRDLHGTYLPNLEDARDEAIQMTRRFAADQVLRGELCLHHRVDVEDLEGQVVLTLAVREAVEIKD